MALKIAFRYFYSCSIPLIPGQKPSALFETVSALLLTHDFAPPSVKTATLGSIESIFLYQENQYSSCFTQLPTQQKLCASLFLRQNTKPSV